MTIGMTFRNAAVPAAERRALLEREQLIATIAGEYRRMAGLSLTQAQAQRLFDVDPDRFKRILGELVDRGVVKIDADGLLVRGDGDPFSD
jgi:hypothetical protein